MMVWYVYVCVCVCMHFDFVNEWARWKFRKLQHWEVILIIYLLRSNKLPGVYLRLLWHRFGENKLPAVFRMIRWTKILNNPSPCLGKQLSETVNIELRAQFYKQSVQTEQVTGLISLGTLSLSLNIRATDISKQRARQHDTFSATTPRRSNCCPTRDPVAFKEYGICVPNGSFFPHLLVYQPLMVKRAAILL